MARTSYQNVLALADAAQNWNFDLFFPTIPGSAIPSNNLTYKCKGTSIPGSTVEVVKIELHGVAKQEAGRATYEHSFTATFLETVDYTTLNGFRAWRDYMRSWKSNTGTDSAAYKVNLELDLYDNGGNVVNTIILVGAWPTQIDQVQLSGSDSAAAIEISMTFSFDYLNDGISF